MTDNNSENSSENNSGSDSDNCITKRRGRKPDNETHRIRYRISYLNPENNLPISYKYFYTIDEVASSLGIGKQGVYAIIKRGTTKHRYTIIEKVMLKDGKI